MFRGRRPRSAFLTDFNSGGATDFVAASKRASQQPDVSAFFLAALAALVRIFLGVISCSRLSGRRATSLRREPQSPTSDDLGWRSLTIACQYGQARAAPRDATGRMPDWTAKTRTTPLADGNSASHREAKPTSTLRGMLPQFHSVRVQSRPFQAQLRKHSTVLTAPSAPSQRH